MIEPSGIRALCRRIAGEFRPERIILFGSHASGRARENSDVDLLVVMPFQGKGARKSAEILNRVEPAFPVDVIVRTPRQMHERLADRDFFLRDVVKFTRAPIRREVERSGVACRLTPSAQT